MMRFLTAGGASLVYEVDLSEVPYANLSLFTEDLRNIPFHLSLRLTEQRAVTNRMVDGSWLGEQPTDTNLKEGLNRVEISFAERGLEVILNGAPLLQASAEEFPDTEATQLLDWNGGVLRETLHIGGLANAQRTGEGMLALGPDFMLTGWAFDPGQPEQSPAIAVDGMEGTLYARVTTDPVRAQELGTKHENLAVRAPLPGRLWLYADAQGVLRVRAMSNGFRCGAPLELTREILAEAVEDMTRRQAPDSDSYTALCALEHVRFARLYDDLSPAAQRFVVAAAKLYRVTDWLFPEGVPGGAERRPAPPAETPGALLARRLQEMLSQRLAADPQAEMIPELERLLQDWPLDGQARRLLVLALMEPACQSGQPGAVEGLHRLIADVPLDTEQDGWALSLRLPLILLRSGLEETAAALQVLADQGKGWACPAALGWVMGRIATHDNNPWQDRHVESALRSLMQVTGRIAKGHWRAPCQVLISGAVALLGQSGLLPDKQALTLRDFALRCFGTAPEFWRQAAAAGVPMDAMLRATRRAFAVITDETSARGALDAALRHMQAIGVYDAPRLRLELLGPGGGSDAALAPEATGLNVGDLALRSLAFPGQQAGQKTGQQAGQHPDMAEQTETARAALIRRWNNVDKAPYYSAQKTASRQIRDVMAALEAGADDAEITRRIDALLPGLRKLSGQASGFLGFALMLILIGKLTRRGLPLQAERLLAQLDQIRAALPHPASDGIAEAPAVRSALARLDRDSDLHSAPVVQAALALFPDRAPVSGLYPETTARVPGDEAASPLFDTLVTVFSCKPYLDSRAAAMRAGWLQDLAAMGIPYIIVVGDGDGRLDGDVVHLEAPDDYEGLPYKTLATAKWVFENTAFDHMLKIDDDCFLNVDEYFGSLSYRKFDYYGRALSRAPGQMNRTWHHEKSSTERARSELDKSPEPSSYADGGGGYTLSRHAMKSLLEAASSAEGWRLLGSSYMEDKLVGDLLALRRISVASEDYFTTIQRRSHGPARPVMLWDNYFLPSAAAPCKMAHLDTAEAQGPTRALAQEQGLFPRKLWPTWSAPALGFGSNQLELLTDEATLTRLNAADLAVICTARNELPRLSQFLQHYRSLGVDCFLFVDNVSDDGTREYLLEQPDCVVFSADTHYRMGRYGLSWQVMLMAQLRLGRWSLIADADELLVYRGWRKGGLAKFVSAQAQDGADAFRLPMIDMYPQGPLSGVDPDADPFDACGFTDRAPIRRNPLYRGMFANDTTDVSAVRHRLLPEARGLTFLAQKYALLRYRPWMRLSEGLHFAAQVQRGAEEAFAFAHMKYDAGFAARVTAEVARGQHFNEAEEYRHYAELLSGGDLSFYDARVSVPWEQSETARAVLG